MKKHDMVFKFFGKKYILRRGGNLHAIQALVGGTLPFLTIAVIAVLFTLI